MHALGLLLIFLQSLHLLAIDGSFWNKNELRQAIFDFLDQDLGGSYEEADMCTVHELNSTNPRLRDSLKYCPNRLYRIRRVRRSQISWKAVQNENKSVANEQSAKERVHTYLVFLLVLPDHPFSTNAERLLSQVAPMFPQITLIAGDAFEFSDMAARYFAHSFPKMLFFKNGIYVGDLPESSDITAPVVWQLTQWTRALPQSALNANPVVSKAIEVGHSTVVVTVPGLKFQLSFPLPTPNLEPFHGTLDDFAFWEQSCFLLFITYLVCRSISLF